MYFEASKDSPLAARSSSPDLQPLFNGPASLTMKSGESHFFSTVSKAIGMQSRVVLSPFELQKSPSFFMLSKELTPAGDLDFEHRCIILGRRSLVPDNEATPLRLKSAGATEYKEWVTLAASLNHLRPSFEIIQSLSLW